MRYRVVPALERRGVSACKRQQGRAYCSEKMHLIGRSATRLSQLAALAHMFEIRECSYLLSTYWLLRRLKMTDSVRADSPFTMMM